MEVSVPFVDLLSSWHYSVCDCQVERLSLNFWLLRLRTFFWFFVGGSRDFIGL